MQIFADVTGREFAVAASDAGARARLGDVRSGGGRRGRRRLRLDRRGVAAHGASRRRARYRPVAATTPSTTSSTREYVRLHDLFGRGGDDVMRTLRAIQRAVIESDPVGSANLKLESVQQRVSLTASCGSRAAGERSR